MASRQLLVYLLCGTVYICALLFPAGYRLLAVCSHHKERFSAKFSGEDNNVYMFIL